MAKLHLTARACAPALALALATAAAAAPVEGVITYPPSFFAAQRPNNAREMLERLPGFTLDYGAAVRGFEGAAGNVLIDGQRPASKTDGLYEVLTRIPAGKVARIELVRGGAPGIDMQGKSVVANVVLKADAGLRGQLSAWASQPLSDERTGTTVKAEASGGADGRSWQVSGELARVVVGVPGDGPATTLYPDGRPPRRGFLTTEHDGEYLLGTGAYELPLAGGRLRLNGRLFLDKQKLEEDNADLGGADLQSNDLTQVTDDWELGGGFNRALSAATDLELVALRQSREIDSASVYTGENRQAFENDRTTRETIARAVLKRRWTATLSSEAGAEAAENRLVSRTRFAVDGAEVDLPAANVQVVEDRWEGFGKAAWKPSAAWSLDGAVRYERSTIAAGGDVALAKTLSYLRPRLALAWSPRPATQLRLRVEREVGQLNFGDFVAQANLGTATGVTAGNPDLVPERAWVAEAAFEQRFWTRGAVVLTVGRYEVEGVVDRGPVFTSTGVFDRPANIGDGTKDVVRLDLTLPLEKLGLEGAQLKGFVTRRWSQVDDPTTGEPRRISGQRPVEWEAHFTHDLPARGITWGASAYGGWQQVYYRFNAVDVLKLDPFLMAFVEWRPRRDLDVRFELQNLTGRGQRRTTVTWPGPRNAGGAAVVTDRDPHFGRLAHVRVRKSFGP